MNAYKLNSTANYHLRMAICKWLDINFSEVYKTVESINNDQTIKLKDGRKFKLKLEEVIND
jgi:hypothetical protein